MGKRVLKEFIQSLQNRVNVAVSLTVIKSKPGNTTGEQHAENIQQLVYDNWVKDSYVSFFENKIIKLHYEKLYKEMNELLRPKEHTNFLLRPKEDADLLINTLDESFPGVCLEDDILDASVPGVYSEDTINGSFPGMCSEEDAQVELIPGVYSEDTQNVSFPDLCSEEDTLDELMPVVCSEDDSQDELIPGVCPEECLYDELNEIDSDFDDIDLFENNVSFIQAMVQLKFPVFSSGCLTVDIIHNFLEKFVKNANLHKYGIKNVFSISDSTVFGELSACTVADLNVDQIRIIINSSRTEYLLKKCLTSVIYFAYKNIHNNTNAIFYSWHGSLMEYLCSVLEDISFHPVCTDYLSKLILKSLDDIWSSEDSSKHALWEHQQLILSVFCVNTYVCESVISFIIIKFDVLINLLNTIQIGTLEHLLGIHLIEKLPHFTQFLCLVIKKLQFYKAAEMYHIGNQIKYNNSVKVTDLWKLKWRVNNVNELDHQKKAFQDLLQRWTITCEKLIIISSTNFPLISVHIWDIMKTLENWNTEMIQPSHL